MRSSYLKLRGLKLGFLLNFGANLMRDGIERWSTVWAGHHDLRERHGTRPGG